jgi:hypothetical protein
LFTLLSGCLNRVKPSILRCMGVDGDNSIYELLLRQPHRDQPHLLQRIA